MNHANQNLRPFEKHEGAATRKVQIVQRVCHPARVEGTLTGTSSV